MQNENMRATMELIVMTLYQVALKEMHRTFAARFS